MSLRFGHFIGFRRLAAVAGSAVVFVLAFNGTAVAAVDLVGQFVNGDQSLALGAKSTYVFRITNTSKGPAANIDASVHVPPELMYVDHVNGNTCSYGRAYGKRVVHCYLTGRGGGGTLGAGQSVKFKVVLKARQTGTAACTDADWSGFYPGPNKCLWGYAGDSSPSDPNLNNNHDNYRVRVG